MKREHARRLISEGAIGLSLAAGAYFIAVEPLQRAAADRAMQADARFLSTRSIDPARDLADLRAMRDRADAVARAAECTADELAVMDRLTHAAESLGLKIANIEKRNIPQPESPPTAQPGTAPDAAPAAPAAPPPKERCSGFALAAVGTYSQALALINTIQTTMGLSSVDSIRITPAGDDADPKVAISIDTRHWWFDAEPTRRLLKLASQSEPEGAR